MIYRKNTNCIHTYSKPKLLTMKQFILACLAVAALLSACNNNKSTAEVTKSDTTQTLSAEAIELQKVAEEMKKQADELQKLPPLSADELKAMLPETLMGGKRTNFQANSAPGTGVATAEYAINDSTKIEVSIYDCGGPGGAGFFNAQYIAKLNHQSETDNEYTKTIDFRGKAIEHCQKNSNRCTLTYFTGKRYMVIIEGQNVHPDGLKQAAMELNI